MEEVVEVEEWKRKRKPRMSEGRLLADTRASVKERAASGEGVVQEAYVESTRACSPRMFRECCLKLLAVP